MVYSMRMMKVLTTKKVLKRLRNSFYKEVLLKEINRILYIRTEGLEKRQIQSLRHNSYGEINFFPGKKRGSNKGTFVIEVKDNYMEDDECLTEGERVRVMLNKDFGIQTSTTSWISPWENLMAYSTNKKYIRIEVI